MRGRHALFGTLALLSIGASALGTSAPAADATSDAVIDVFPGLVGLDDNDGKCSLREAFQNLSTHARTWRDCPAGAVNTTINLPQGTYALNGVALAQIQSGITRIAGAGADLTIIEPGTAVGILAKGDPIAGAADVTISGLTIRDTVLNKSQGAVYFKTDTRLTVTDSSFEHNTGKYEGQAIFFQGNTLRITRSLFLGNAATSGNPGGAIALSDSTGYASVIITNSTFVDNSATDGAAIGTMSNTDTLEIYNSTFRGNDAKSNGAFDGFGSTIIKNSIVSRGSVPTSHKVCPPDVDTRSDRNITDDPSCVRSFSRYADLGLGQLDLHGGHTSNFLPFDTSPAIDAALDSVCALAAVGNVDQRGLSRQGQGVHCDIGAVERQQQAAPLLPVLSATKSVTGDFSEGGAVTYTITLSNSGDADQPDNPGHEFADVLPAGTRLVGASASAGKLTLDMISNAVAWDGGVTPGNAVTIAINATVTAKAGTSVSNQATVKWDANGTGSNDSTLLTDNPDLPGASDATAFTVTAPRVVALLTRTGARTVSPGDTVSMRLEVSNTGDGFARGLVIADTPAGSVSLVPGTVTTSVGTVTSGNGLGDSGFVVVVEGLSPSATAAITFDALIESPLAAGVTEVSNQASVLGDNFDEVLSSPASGAPQATTIPITSHPELTLALAGAPPNATPGSTFAIGFEFSNPGDVSLDNVALTVLLPASTSFDSASSSAGWTCTATRCTLTIGDLVGLGGSGTAELGLHVDESIPDTLVSIEGSAAIADGDTSTSTAFSVPVSRPSLSASIDGPEVTHPGASIEYEVTVANSGDANASGVQVDLALPPGVTFASSSDCEAVSAGLVRCAIGTVASGSSTSVRVNASVNNSVDGPSFSLAGTLGWNESATKLDIQPLETELRWVDLVLSVDADLSVVREGDDVTYTIHYANAGTATAASVEIRGLVPGGIIVAGDNEGWTCDPDGCSLHIDTLAAGEPGDATLSVSYPDLPANANSVRADFAIADDGMHGDDHTVSDNSAQVELSIIRADLAAAFKAPANVRPSEPPAIVVEVSNNGAADSPAVVQIQLPAGLHLDGGASDSACVQDVPLVKCAVDNLDAGGVVEFKIATTFDATPPDGAELALFATADAGRGETNFADNSAQATILVEYALDLAARLSAPPSIATSAPITFEAELENLEDPTRAAVSLILPAGLVIEGVSPPDQLNCTTSGHTVVCSGNMESGTTSVFRVSASVDEQLPAPETFTAVMEAELWTGNHDAPLHLARTYAATTVSFAANVEMALAVRAVPAMILPGGSTRYVIEIANRGDALFEPLLTLSPLPGVILDSIESVPAGLLRCAGDLPVACEFRDGRVPRAAKFVVQVNARSATSARANDEAGLAVNLSSRSGSVDALAKVTFTAPPDLLVPIPQEPNVSDGSVTYSLGFRWTLITWAGEDLDLATGMPGGSEATERIEAVYSWDALHSAWLGYFPGLPISIANDLRRLRMGQAYWVAVSEGPAVWWAIDVA